MEPGIAGATTPDQHRAARRQRAARARHRQARRGCEHRGCAASPPHVCRAADADRIGGVGHRARRFNACVLLPGGVSPLLPVACRERRALYLWSVAACFAALFSKQNTITLRPRARRVRLHHRTPPGRVVVGVVAAVRPIHRADRRIPVASLRGVRADRAREHADTRAVRTVRPGPVDASPAHGLWRIGSGASRLCVRHYW